MTIEEMRQLDAVKTYKELEETKKTNAELVQRMKEDGEYIFTLSERCLRYHESVLKYKEEIKRLTDKIQELYEGAEKQKQRIKRLEDAGDELVGSADAMEAWRKAREANP
jgi:uncharacterized protein Yka (UPF0111/DUF47 family)